MRKFQQQVRQRWMADFERRVLERSPAHAGRINWDAAAHLCNEGHGPDEAAARFVANEQPMDRR